MPPCPASITTVENDAPRRQLEVRRHAAITKRKQSRDESMRAEAKIVSSSIGGAKPYFKRPAIFLPLRKLLTTTWILEFIHE
jgi:hypothetical protein